MEGTCVSMSIRYCSNASASRTLAKSIEVYWHQKGAYDVRVWVERDTGTYKKALYVIRSNMVLSCI